MDILSLMKISFSKPRVQSWRGPNSRENASMKKLHPIRAAFFSQSLLYFEPLSRIRIPKG